jgi:hypothetical protein
MLKLYQIATVRRLLAAKLSRRAVYRLTGVSRGSIGRIAAGGCSDRDAPTVAPTPAFPFAQSGPVQRCSACGQRVHAPCLICRARDWIRRKASCALEPADADPATGVLGLELRGEHRARYEAMRVRRAGRSRPAA